VTTCVASCPTTLSLSRRSDRDHPPTYTPWICTLLNLDLFVSQRDLAVLVYCDWHHVAHGRGHSAVCDDANVAQKVGGVLTPIGLGVALWLVTF